MDQLEIIIYNLKEVTRALEEYAKAQKVFNISVDVVDQIREHVTTSTLGQCYSQENSDGD